MTHTHTHTHTHMHARARMHAHAHTHTHRVTHTHQESTSEGESGRDLLCVLSILTFKKKKKVRSYRPTLFFWAMLPSPHFFGLFLPYLSVVGYSLGVHVMSWGCDSHPPGCQLKASGDDNNSPFTVGMKGSSLNWHTIQSPWVWNTVSFHVLILWQLVFLSWFCDSFLVLILWQLAALLSWFCDS